MSEKNLVKPRLPGGFKDLPPEEFAQRQWALDKAFEVYRSFGFKPLDTSAVEHFEALAGGDETSKQIYRLFNQNPDFSGESLALRFDLTVSLARMIATDRKAFTFPFKRCQAGYVWRGERQQMGRFKQFLQLDADVVGAFSPAADAEMVLLVDRTMTALGVKRFTVRLNNRKILSGFIRSLGLGDEDVEPFLRILDKLDKVGKDGVAQRLGEPKPSPEEAERGAEGLGMKLKSIEKVLDLIELETGNMRRVEVLRKMLPDAKVALEGLDDIETVLKLVDAAGVSEGCIVSFDPSVARGLGYYTGTVYETFLDDAPAIGSVMSGGRYDDLVERFSSEKIPATGISLGVDRLLVGLGELGILDRADYSTEVLVIGMEEELTADAFALASKLRKEGLRAEVYLGDNLKLKKQLTYASRSGIKFCAIIGQEEKYRGAVQLKNMSTGIQKELPFDQIAAAVKGED